MVSARWEEIKIVFEAALLHEERQWPTFLADRCGSDAELADEVLRLLIADREASKFLDEPAFDASEFASLGQWNDAFEPHEILCGRFEILQSLGEGGMGRVYEALDLELQESVAIKAIRWEIADTPGILARFKREVFATRKVTHPNVCRTFDLESHWYSEGDSTRKISFLTMELLRGETLAEHLRRSGPLPVDEVRVLAQQLASALLAAHEAGIIHCDLKPANIFLTRTDAGLRAVVTDFGIAKLTLQAHEQAASALRSGHTTLVGPAVGTPLYMAPEQAESGTCTPASDLYSYGLVIHEALTGQRPSADASPLQIEATLYALAASLNQPPPTVEPMWGRLLAGCLERNPEARFQHAQQALDVLADAPPAQSPGWRALPRTRPWLFYGSLAIVLLLALSLGRYLQRRAAASAEPSVAVLAFANRNHDPALKDLGDTIAVDLTSNLAQVTGLRVPSHSLIEASEKPQDIRSVGSRLDVDTVLNGSIARQAEDLVVQVELVDAHTGAQIWGRTYTRPQSSLPALQQDIAQEVAYRLRIKTGFKPGDKPHAHIATPASQAAYAKALSAMAEYTAEGRMNAVNYFHQAIDADPKSAPAYAGLANAYTAMANNYNRPEAPLELMANAETAARQALRADSGSLEAYLSLAQVELLRDYNWSSAEELFKRAAEIDPSYLPAHTSYAVMLLTARGRFGEALAQFAYADRTPPKKLSVEIGEALSAYYARRYEDSIQQALRIQQQSPENEVVLEILAENYIAIGAPEKALSLLQNIPPKSEEARMTRDAMLGVAYAKQGQNVKALQILKQMEVSRQIGVEQNFHLAALAASVGDFDKAMGYLEKSYTRRQMSMLFLGVDPLMDPLRQDLRFQSMLTKLNLN